MTDIMLKAMPFDSNEVMDTETGEMTYDRVAYSRDLADWMKTYFLNGILVPGGTSIASQLKVAHKGSLTCKVSPGGIIINGRSAWLESEQEVSVTMGGSQPRIDRIVAELNIPNDRGVYIKVLEGTPASSPVAPGLTRTEDVYQMSLAQIRIPANSALISTVTDERSKDTVCGVSNVGIGVKVPEANGADNIFIDTPGHPYYGDAVDEAFLSAIDTIAEKGWEKVADYNAAGTHTFRAPENAEEYLWGAYLIGGGGGGNAASAYSSTSTGYSGYGGGGASGFAQSTAFALRGNESISFIVGAGGRGGKALRADYTGGIITTLSPEDGASTAFRGVIAKGGGKGENASGKVSIGGQPSSLFSSYIGGAMDYSKVPYGGVSLFIQTNPKYNFYPGVVQSINPFIFTDSVLCAGGSAYASASSSKVTFQVIEGEDLYTFGTRTASGISIQNTVAGQNVFAEDGLKYGAGGGGAAAGNNVSSLAAVNVYGGAGSDGCVMIYRKRKVS